MKKKIFRRWPDGSIITQHFDINSEGVILDLITPNGVFYAEYDNKHKLKKLTKWL